MIFTIESYDIETLFSQWFPAPLLSLRYSYYIPKWEFDVLVGGVAAKIQTSEIAYMNLDAAARYKFFRKDKWLGMVSLGIKYIPMYVSTEQDDFSFTTNTQFFGPFIGLRFKYLKD